MKIAGFFPKKKSQDDLLLVFHLSSTEVSGALFVSNPQGSPRIIFSLARELKLETGSDSNLFLKNSLSALSEIAKEIHSKAMGAPRRVFCVLASPWYASETRTISYKSEQPFLFTEKFADELIQKEIKSFAEENENKYGGAHVVRPIELKSIKTMLNGYEASKPLNQKAKELEMVTFVSMSEHGFLEKVEEAISRYFHAGPIKFSSFAMSSFTVVRDLYHMTESFLLVDIGGEVTEIYMTKKGVLRESISYPLGKNFLIRGVAQNLGSTLNEASSLIALWKNGHAETSLSKKIENIIKSLKTEWLNQFQTSLANLSKDISIPSKIFIVVESEFVDLFAEIIKSEQFSQYTLAESKFEVTFLGADLLHQAAQFDESRAGESFLAIDIVYISRFLTKI